MNQYVVLFCHTPITDLPLSSAQELYRQYNLLTQFAFMNNLAIDHCFFHEGSLNIEDPDELLLKFLHCIQTVKMALVLVENAEIFSENLRDYFPPIRICAIRDRRFIEVQQGNFSPKERTYLYPKVFRYSRLACSSQFEEC